MHTTKKKKRSIAQTQGLESQKKKNRVHWAKAVHLIADILRWDLGAEAEGRENVSVDGFARKFGQAIRKGDVKQVRGVWRGLRVGLRLRAPRSGSRSRSELALVLVPWVTVTVRWSPLVLASPSHHRWCRYITVAWKD